MLDIFDAVTAVLLITVPLAAIAAYLLREKEVKSAKRTHFYTKAASVLGWLMVAVLFAAAVIELIQGEYFVMAAHFILFGVWVHLMNRGTTTQQKV
jgi:uncharacterized membrane protein YidH (DUF202 family)